MGALLAAAVTRSALVVDHHNFGYSLLALKLGRRHPLVLLYATLEKYCGRHALGGFCVTEAMKEFLAGWGVSAIALHDKPASIFKPTSLEKQHDLFLKLWEDRTLRFWKSGGRRGQRRRSSQQGQGMLFKLPQTDLGLS